MNMRIKNTGLLIALSAFASVANAQNAPYYPSQEEIIDRYRQGAIMDSITKNKVLNSNPTLHWNPKDESYCWYAKETAPQTYEYFVVDTKTGAKKQAFNMAALLQSLAADTIVTSKDISQVFINKQHDTIRYVWNRGEYQYIPNTNQTQKIRTEKSSKRNPNRFANAEFTPRWSRWRSFATDSVSGDKKWTATVRNGNVYLLNHATGKEQRYTEDGTEQNPYGGFAWSPDSKYLIAYHIHPVIDSNVYYVLSSVEGTTRGVLKSHPYKQPGDPFTTFDMFLIDPTAPSHTIKVKTDAIDFFEAPQIHWENNPQYFSYERVDRGHQRFRIIKVNAQTGDTTHIVDEKTNTFIYEARLVSYYLPATHEIIRSSEKDGWQHLYLVDDRTGKEKLITKGNWVVRNVDSVDAVKREIWFSASGMNSGEDPYFIHYYRIGLDGKNLVSLTPETGNHSVHYSPDKQFFLDTYSQINMAPVTVLKRVTDGKMISSIEKADISRLLATGVSLPEPFAAKGRDGQTDIYGIYLKPSHFDPTKKYPVIENIYAGPHDSFVPKSFLGYSEMQSIADLGFIVVYIDGMGTANRSKAFHDVCWKNIEDAGFPDRILWIKALAAQHPFVDTSRVGIYGTSAGGQDALCALLSHPEFYKAAVAACGCHDNRIDKQWWNEQWMGYPVGPHYDAQSNVTNAYKLQGNLLLIVGEADTNVPPESTYRVADALIKAGKDFDFLPIPGSDHTDGGPFGRMKTKDFFVRSLLGVPPPARNSHPEFTLPKTGVRPTKVI